MNNFMGCCLVWTKNSLVPNDIALNPTITITATYTKYLSVSLLRSIIQYEIVAQIAGTNNENGSFSFSNWIKALSLKD